MPCGSCEAGSPFSRCRIHFRPHGAPCAVRRCRAWDGCRSVHASPLCSACGEGTCVDLGAYQGSACCKKAQGIKLGNPRAAEAAIKAQAAHRASADRFAANILPVVESIQGAGISSHAGIADALNKRGVRTARGGRWHATTVRNLLARRLK